MKKNYLIISGVNPHSVDAFEAANTVTFHIIDELSNHDNFKLYFLYINNHKVKWTKKSLNQKKQLIDKGVIFLKDLVLQDKKFNKKLIFKLHHYFFGNLEYIFPGIEHQQILKNKIQKLKINKIITIWSEYATAMLYNLNYDCYAYYGNPVPKTIKFRWTSRYKNINRRLNFKESVNSLIELSTHKQIEKYHLRMMSGLKKISNVALNDSNYYVSKGINCSYIRNIWGKLENNWSKKKIFNKKFNHIKIVGNLGNRAATGNTEGLRKIALEISPLLRKKLSKLNKTFSIHIYGGGKSLRYVESLLDNDPNIIIEGFVDDINKEIQESDIFLVANNFSPLFRVSNTRFLHAFSQGACCVGFTGSSEAMPELKHKFNCLLGKDSEDLTDNIVEIIQNKKMYKKIQINGFQTVKNQFNPKKVVTDLIKDFEL